MLSCTEGCILRGVFDVSDCYRGSPERVQSEDGELWADKAPNQGLEEQKQVGEDDEEDFEQAE